MATADRRKRPKSITNLLGDVLDDTKDLVDDVLDRAGDLERDARKGARRVVKDTPTPDDEVDSLKAAIDELAAKVDRLANLQSRPGRSRR